MRDIKSYRTDRNSLSSGQVLPRPYPFAEARIVFSEMVDVLCADMFTKNLVSPVFSWYVFYDYKSLEAVPDYDGPVSLDYYGRLHPSHSGGTVRTRTGTNSVREVMSAMLALLMATSLPTQKTVAVFTPWCLAVSHTGSPP